MGKDTLEARIASKFDKRWKQPFGLGRIQVDLFTWEITSQRTRSPRKKATNQSQIQPTTLVSPTIEVQLRSTPRTPIQTLAVLEKRQRRKDSSKSKSSRDSSQGGSYTYESEGAIS